MASVKRISVNLAYALLVGYVFCFYSEWMFWGGQVRRLDVFEHVGAWLLYSFAAYVFLLTVHYFRVRSLWAMFLAGAVYGWLVEGVLVQTMYDNFPLHISLTGLSWHALITVCCGWYFLRCALQESAAAAVRVSVGLGVFYGLWSIGWGIEEPLFDPLTFGLYAFTLGVLLVVAYVGIERLGDAAFRPTRAEGIVALIIIGVYFVFITVPTQPLALLILPPVMAFVLFFLRHNRQHEPVETVTTPKAPLRRLLPTFLIPILIVTIFTLFYSGNLHQLPTRELTYLVTAPAGFILLLVSAYRVWKRHNIKSP